MKSIPVSIQGALQETLQAQGLGHLLQEARLREKWTELMGKRAAGIAEMESLKDGLLSVRVADAAWRNELHYQRDALRLKANQILGMNTVKDVRLR
jgi:predicted nucleic acid-binding Zn ribbon protein